MMRLRSLFAILTSTALGATAAALGCGSTQSSNDGGTSDGGTQDSRVDAGPPVLTELAISGAKGDLTPKFSSDVFDYYVPCAAGTNALSVSMTASTGSLSLLTAPSSSPSKAMQTVSVSVKESEAIVAEATNGKAKTDYWVRCLPPDFPPLNLTKYPGASPAPGYYLLGTALPLPSVTGYAIVMDGNGVPVWYHALTVSKIGLSAVDVDNVVDGAVSFIPDALFSFNPFEIDQLSPHVIKTVAPKGFTTDEHELRVLPNGNYVVLSYPLKSGVDLTGVKIPTGDGGSLEPGPNSTIQDCTVVEFNPATGEVAWSWNASDHFDPVKDTTYPQTGFGPKPTLPDGGTIYDMYHCDSVDIDPVNGNILVSARHMDSVFYIDRSSASGKVLWKMGGADASVDDATYVAVDHPYFRQHDARLVKGWSPTCNGGTGQVSVFDDETAKGEPARAAIYDVIVGGGDKKGCGAIDGGTPGQAKQAWEYKGTAPSGGSGSVRISADGSRVIGWGIDSSDPIFTEVDEHGNKLLELRFGTVNGLPDISYRAIKVPTSAFDLAVLRSTAGQ
jgi:hypothetical protein